MLYSIYHMALKYFESTFLAWASLQNATKYGKWYIDLMHGVIDSQKGHHV